MKLSRRCTMAVLWAFAWASCTDNTPPPQPASFERPTRVAFVCVDRAQLALQNPQAALVPLDKCQWSLVADAGAGVPINSVTNTPGTDYALHSLVTQSSRGEVAAVDMQTGRVIDSRPDIPGETFVPVGEVPISIAAAKNFPHTTYVANAGSRDISVAHTSAFLHTSSGDDVMAQRVRVRPDTGSTAGIPFDMILSPDEDALFITSAESGWLLRIPIVRCADGQDNCGQLAEDQITRVPLENSWSKLSPDAFESPQTLDEPYRFVCPEQPRLLAIPDKPVPLPDPGLDVGTPQPAGMAIDAFCAKGSCTRRLLIADKHQPIVHAVDIDALAEGRTDDAILTPIMSGAPTERVAVSPRVPVSLESSDETQYVYAIDTRDGSVLVAQDGKVRNVGVNPSLRSDRLDLGASLATGAPVAVSLEVVTPDYEVNEPASQWVQRSATAPTEDNPLICLDPDHQSRLASRLRGVFLAVGSTDGSVRIVNVHDMEAKACRSCERTQVPNFSMSQVGYDPYPVVRHRARIGITYTSTGLDQELVLAPIVTPQYEIAGAAIGVKPDGTTNDPRAAGLDCVTCSDQQAVTFPSAADVTALPDAGVSAEPLVDGGTAANPGIVATSCDPGQGRVCSLADPFVDPFSWVGVYEGPVPGTRGGHGRFVPSDDPDNRTGSLEFVGDPDFCAAGVFGDESVKIGDATQVIGDQLLITSELPTSTLRTQVLGADLDETENNDCALLVSERDVDNGAIAFRIRRAFSDRLVIDPQLIKATEKQPDADYQQVQRCFAGLGLTFQVHSRGSFVVQSSGTIGFQHRIKRDDATGRCVVDSSIDPRRSSRAVPGLVFDNGLISFKPLGSNGYERLTVLRLTSFSSATKLLLNGSDIGSTTPLFGVQAVDLRYSPSDRRLYAVDITSRGLIPLSLDPMPFSVAIDGTIQ